MLNLNELNVFLAAAETGSYSAAGRKLGLSQPAVSQSIDSLERRLGVTLFARIGRSVQLTEAGLALTPLARELLFSSRRLEDQMNCLDGDICGQVSIGAAAQVGESLLVELMSHFRHKYSQVSFSLRSLPVADLSRALHEGQVDLGLFPSEVTQLDLEQVRIFSDRVLLIAPVAHSCSSLPTICPQQLLDENLVFVLPEPGSEDYLRLDLALNPHHISLGMLNTALHAPTLAAVQAVEAGLGLAFVSQLAARQSLERGTVRQVDLAGFELVSPIYLIRNRRLQPACAPAEFWAFAATFAQEGNLQWDCLTSV